MRHHHPRGHSGQHGPSEVGYYLMRTHHQPRGKGADNCEDGEVANEKAPLDDPFTARD